MGIRFYCPNGHKLNVKEFQAGKMGICPHCQAKVQIPTESTRQISKAGRTVRKPRDAAPAGAAQTRSDGDESPGQPAAVSVAQPSPDECPDPGSAEAPDPLAEAGDVVWYTRPSSGGQFGPAGREVMQTWIEEGRVSADSLVWREGWRDWQEASEVFPQLGAAEDQSPMAGLPAGATLPAVADRRRARSRRRPKNSQTAVVILLVVAVIVLVCVFVWVLRREPQSGTNESSAAAASHPVVRVTNWTCP